MSHKHPMKLAKMCHAEPPRTATASTLGQGRALDFSPQMLPPIEEPPKLSGLINRRRNQMKVTLEIPDDVAATLRRKWPDLSRAILEIIALEGYRSGALTAAQVRRMLGFETGFQGDTFLKENGVYLEESISDIRVGYGNQPSH
jgi:hypothetical protein